MTDLLYDNRMQKWLYNEFCFVTSDISLVDIVIMIVMDLKTNRQLHWLFIKITDSFQ